MRFFIISKYVTITLTSLLLLSSLFSCKKKQDIRPVRKVKARSTAPAKKEAKKQNPKKLLKSMEANIDRNKHPYAGVWEPNAGTGFLLMYPDGKLEIYGRYDKECEKAPKIKGSYKFISGKTIETTIKGETKTIKLKVLSNFVEIGDLGIFWPPTGVTLKEERKEFKDPKKLIDFCRNVNTQSISKVYPYLTKKSKLELLKIGITNKIDLATHENFTQSIKKFLDKYKKITSITSIKNDAKGELFKIILKSQDKVTFREDMIIRKEDGNLRCGLFDTMKLVSSRKSLKQISFWYKEMSKKDIKNIFKLKSNTNNAAKIMELKFNEKELTIKKLKSDKTLISESTRKFKIIANTASVVAISLKSKSNNAKTDEANAEKEEIIVFKSNGEEPILMLINNHEYIIESK